MVTFNIYDICFSIPGSFLCLRADHEHNRIIYATSAREAMSEKWMPYWAANFFEIVLFIDGQEVPYTWQAYPHRLDLRIETQTCASFTFSDTRTLVFQAHTVSVRFLPLKPYKSWYTTADGVLNLVDTGTQHIHQFAPGSYTQLQRLDSIGAFEFSHSEGTTTSGTFRLVPHESFWTQQPAMDVEKAAQPHAEAFQRWLEHLPPVPEQYRATAEKALLLLWNCQVPAQNKLTRRTIFSSKASMNAIWTWDNCFHALAIAPIDPHLAWEQILLPFDYQTNDGALPDSISDSKASFGYTKPPVYGWTISKLIALLGVELCLPYLSQLYEPLCRLTKWWYRQRGSENGMCLYYDGNDSGWDNATTFDSGSPIAGVDLAAYLVLQLETLGQVADLLGYNEHATAWRTQAQQQLTALLSTSAHNGHFHSHTSDTRQPVSPHSLLNMMPLILGKRLPSPFITAAAHTLRPGGPFLTNYGLASESPASPLYISDGYWRGPIWAPPTCFVVDGLHDAGETQLARLIAQRYCDLIAQDAGFYENYDALNGKGLRCPGICWTAAVFLHLATFLAEP